MSAATKLLSKLGGVKKSKSGWSARCPAHEDRQASLSVAEGDAGRVLLHCHAGCSTKAIVDVLGLEERDLFDTDATRPATPKKSSSSKPATKAGKAYATADAAQEAYERTLGEPAAIYEYRDASGQHVGSVIRWRGRGGKKKIRPISLHADGWRLEQMAEPRPLYMIECVLQTPGSALVVAEGEKCVHALSFGLGLRATTSSGGSNAASKTDWSTLAGREVAILPDADDAGRKYADEVAAILLGLNPPATVRVVELDGLEPGGDVADLYEACRSDEELQALRERIDRLVDEAEPLKPEAATPSTSSTSSPVDAWRPFPTATLPKVVATLVEESARAIGCDEAFVALPLLAVLGSAIGTTRRVELKPGWRALPIVWPVTVAESGSQKSPAADVSLDHVREREDRLYDEYLSRLADFNCEKEEYEKARDAWKHSKAAGGSAPSQPPEPIQRRVMVEDATSEALVAALGDNPRGLLVATDEFSGLLGSMGRYNGTAAADEALYLKAYSGRSHNVSRRTGRSIHVRQAAVCLTGTIQPGVLARALGVERRESGLAARLLLAAPPRRPKKWTTDAVGWTTREDFVRVLDNLYGLEHDLASGKPEPKIVRLSSDAEKLFVKFFTEHDAEALELAGDLAAAWSKLEETAGRLALIFHETRLAAGEDMAADEIDADSMAAGIELVGWFKHETRRVYTILGQTGEEAAARQADDRLAAWVAKQGGTVAPREVIAGCHRWLATSDAVEVALRRLVDAGRGHWVDKPAGERGGRPTRLFVLDQPAEAEPRKAKPPSAQPRREAVKEGCSSADARRAAEVEEALEI
jgi:hypothetical protein